MRGSVRIIGNMMVLPYDHIPQTSLGAEVEGDLDVMVHGIQRDLKPYQQTVSGTTTLAIQTIETSRTIKNHIDQLTMVHEVLEETYRLLNVLQTTSQTLAEARPSPEYARAVSRNRRWTTKHKEALLQPPDTPWAFVDKTMPQWMRPHLRGPAEQWDPLVKFGLTRGLCPALNPLHRPDSDYDTFSWFARPAASYGFGRDMPAGAKIFTDGSLLDGGWAGYNALGWAFVAINEYGVPP
jgi:hypothetical protein